MTKPASKKRKELERLETENNERFVALQEKIGRAISIDANSMRNEAKIRMIVNALIAAEIVPEDFYSDENRELEFQKFFSQHLDDYSDLIEEQVRKIEAEKPFVKPPEKKLALPGVDF